MNTLEGHVAVVTGGTFGVGRGIASALAHAGARVFVTGRSVPDGAPIAEHITGIRCDHRLDGQVTAAVARVARETHGIDIIGRAVAALAGDPNVMRHSGTVLVAARLAVEYGFTDIDGRAPRPLTLADV